MATESLEDPARRYAVLFPGGSLNVHADIKNGPTAHQQAIQEAKDWNDNVTKPAEQAKVVTLTLSDIRPVGPGANSK